MATKSTVTISTAEWLLTDDGLKIDDATWGRFYDEPRRKPLSARRVKRTRKPNIRKMVVDAEKAGKSVTGITMPDGTVLHFGGEADDASKAWDEALTAKRRTLDAKPN